MNTRFEKRIEQTDTGMVIAEVYELARGRRVGLEFFTWPPFAQAVRLRRAHRWANEWIGNCEEYCTQKEETE